MASKGTQRISRSTRNNLVDWLSLSEFQWAGRLEHPDFLARLFDLEKLPSKDYRYKNAARDIYQHAVNNWDWEDDWVFGDDRFNLRDGSDENLLNFLVETVHPVVRDDPAAAAEMVSAYNNTLRRDGFELYPVDHFGDRIIYGTRNIAAYHAPAKLTLAKTPDLTENAVLRRHLDMIVRDLNDDPATAISSCKNLIESQCKIVLTDLNVEFSERDDLPGLFGKVASQLEINADAVQGSSRGSDAIRKAMRALTTTVQSIAEARNAIGNGHGSDGPSPATPRHARLVFNSTVAVAQFIADTWHEPYRKE
ncbi:abortive infection family protein [Leucobacter sp. M11]|uniref:abortive infection family protein n=1 Tax=Leucobacter sp. M11 TaxID=2993565 RepID=UPI002D7EA224|nr:abortive infection family protein [Leucobacter sp. M11]MEB4613728.1 abortive infection family protein [Leucobacter sp. M11]